MGFITNLISGALGIISKGLSLVNTLLPSTKIFGLISILDLILIILAIGISILINLKQHNNKFVRIVLWALGIYIFLKFI